MQIVTPRFPDEVGGLVNIHHSFLAGVHRCGAVSVGQRTRSQTRWGNGPLRHRELGRGADHRTGRGARRPPPQCPRPDPARRPCRAGGAVAGGVVAPRGPRHPRGQPNHRLVTRAGLYSGRHPSATQPGRPRPRPSRLTFTRRVVELATALFWYTSQRISMGQSHVRRRRRPGR